ncbi:V-type ATP synthase subunit D [Nonomuraea sp. NPDC049400]|uniref:V-type ATP synthase subunit D n=1 Tax=Nonomuraea sp. NPDC049400 TaxID=3364352 RepID=UPI00379D78BB
MCDRARRPARRAPVRRRPPHRSARVLGRRRGDKISVPSLLPAPRTRRGGSPPDHHRARSRQGRPRDALRAGLEHAIAAEAARIVAAEAASTNRRIRALKDRLLPLLEEALTAIELSLDEMERADIDRVRRIIGSRPQPPSG